MSGVKLIMNNYNHINKILKDCPDLDMDINEVKFKKLSSGKTNQSFLVEDDLKKYVLRLNSKKSLNYNIDRKRELEILNSIRNKSIGPKVVYSDDDYSFLITEFIEGTPLLLDKISNQEAQDLNDLIDKYQKIEINIPRFNYLEHLKKYETFISNNYCINSDLSKKLETFYPHLEDFQNQGWEPVLCHHDLSTFNIIKTNNGLRIIDWEYSAYGHACFDKEYTRLSKSKDNFFNNLFGILDEMWSLINKI